MSAPGVVTTMMRSMDLNDGLVASALVYGYETTTVRRPSVNDFSKSMYTSQTALSRKIKRGAGMTIGQVIAFGRFLRVCEFFTDPPAGMKPTVANVARALSFSNHANLSKWTYRHFGVRPTEIRAAPSEWVPLAVVGSVRPDATVAWYSTEVEPAPDYSRTVYRAPYAIPELGAKAGDTIVVEPAHPTVPLIVAGRPIDRNRLPMILDHLERLEPVDD